MRVDDLAAYVGEPIRLIDGLHGRISEVAEQTMAAEVAVYDGDVVTEVRLVPANRIERLMPGCDALVEMG